MLEKEGYVTYILLCIVGLLVMLSSSLVTPLIANYAKQLGASSVTIGMVVSGYWISRIFLEIPSGFISQKFGLYRVMLTGLVLTGLGNLVMASWADANMLVIGRALMGLGAPLFFAVATTFVLNLFDAERRGRAMGIFQGIEFAGSVLGATFSGYIVSMFTFQTGFLFSAGLVAVALALLVIPRSIREATHAPYASKPLSISSIREVLTNRNLLIVSSATFAEFIMSSGVIFTVFPLYAEETLMISLTNIGLIMGSRSLGFVIAMFTMGYLADRFGRKPVLIFGLSTTALLMGAVVYAPTFQLLATILFLLGITTGAIWIVSPVLAAESVDPSQRGAAIGTYRTFFDLGSILGPIIMTTVLESYGIDWCFYIAAALLVVNLLPTSFLRENS